MSSDLMQPRPLTKWQKLTFLFGIWYVLPVILGIIIGGMTTYISTHFVTIFLLPIPSYISAVFSPVIVASTPIVQVLGVIGFRLIPLLVLIYLSYKFWRSGVMGYRYLALGASVVLHGPFLYGPE